MTLHRPMGPAPRQVLEAYMTSVDQEAYLRQAFENERGSVADRAVNAAGFALSGGVAAFAVGTFAGMDGMLGQSPVLTAVVAGGVAVGMAAHQVMSTMLTRDTRAKLETWSAKREVLEGKVEQLCNSVPGFAEQLASRRRSMEEQKAQAEQIIAPVLARASLGRSLA